MASGMVSISIIIPYLNQPQYLQRCLRSLQQQTSGLDRAEIIVVDNGSKILPDDICKAFPAVRLEQDPRPGPGIARNRGVAVSSGEILAFIDADCVADKNWLSAIDAELAGGGPCQIIGGDVRIGLQTQGQMTMLEAYESVYAYRQRDYIEKQGFSGTGNLAMRRTAYDAVGPFAGIDVAEDRDWGQRATRMGYRIKYLPEMIVFHPARHSFAELTAKWDRHVSHDYTEFASGAMGKVKWAFKIAAMALSPGLEIIRIVRSERISGIRERYLAFTVLVRIRLFRAVRMLELLVKGGRASRSGRWNRE